MRKNRKGSEESGGDDWLNTYADMVTLVLCFFVLLYSMSSLDSEKWEILVKSLNPNAEETSQVVLNEQQNEAEHDLTSEPPTQAEETEFEDLYYQLSEYVEENQLQDSIEVTQGEDYTFIMFKNQVFFAPDSYSLKDEGRVILDEVAGALGSVGNEIGEVKILGHTSQAKPNEVNDLASDRFLSSNRATEVLVYIQKKGLIDPSKLVSSGYGQFRAISPFDTSENRAKNRRVEILITKADSENLKLEDYYKAVYKQE